MVRLILTAFLAILLPFGGVIILSVALLFLWKAKKRAAAVACFLVPPVVVALGLLWWGRSTAFFGSETGAVPWFIVGPALVCAVVGIVAATLTVAVIRRHLTDTRPRTGIKKTLVIVLLAILFSAIAVVFGGLVYIERDTWKSSYRLSNALRNARSVTFVEFTPVESGSFVLARKAATPEDIAGFRSATSPWFLPFQPHGALCFNPHHRVEIVGTDGTQLTFKVCFLCGNFYVDPLVADASTGGAFDLPPSWDKTLSSFFASIGMTPKTQEQYSAFYRRDANDQEEKAQD
jgi:hypothetical protein